MAIVDLSFRLKGTVIPADHGYSLYSSLSRILPVIHNPCEADESSGGALRIMGIHPIRGSLCGSRNIKLTPASRLCIRLDSSHIGDMLPLGGSEIQLDGHPVHIGVPEVHKLIPAASVHSRLVVIKGMMTGEDMICAAKKQLCALGVQGEPALIRIRSATSVEGRSDELPERAYIRRTLKIKDKEIVGYAMAVTGLSADDSLRLQESGVGGRRNFGCGLFVPLDRRRL